MGVESEPGKWSNFFNDDGDAHRAVSSAHSAAAGQCVFASWSTKSATKGINLHHR